MNDLPAGFSMALAQNETAMKRFASMTDPDKQALLQHTHLVRSNKEMQWLVFSLTD